MAYSTLTAPVSAGIPARLAGILSGLFRNWRMRREYRQTVHALRALSARDLADIGLSRCAIPGAAREHVYGK
ncbi:DUF1127 domain-containing protein [Leisingera aquaemixtae]|uniref:DUF1127 domain-containing protein n=1 Tax=Leisingera TaxID=191028 RepID=UPI001C9546A9|nr:MULTISPECIES: DUF1127 domain-containing protein [Leisingera]MBY6068028.1 DUF1127 domain-containing protein [Leisingera aquaemixtae]MCB4458274.1 DUF1127 domain-containing protein [Leisingera sp. McT4-56]